MDTTVCFFYFLGLKRNMAFISNKVISDQDLKNFHEILSHLYGPNSDHIVIKNKTITSSIELYQSLSPKNDVINLMIGYLRQQLVLYKDGGLSVGLLATSIIRNFGEFDAPLAEIMEMNSFVVEWFMGNIQRFSYQCNIGRLKNVIKLIRTILLSKLTLTKEECKQLCLLFARAFTIENPWQDCHVINIEKSEILESALLEGLLLRLDRYSTIQQGLSNANVLLFSVSISLDSEEMLGDSKLDIEVESMRHFKSNLMNKTILRLCKEVVSLVGVVICQKVIHPHAKKYFKDHNVVCIDRVGGSFTPLLERVCNCVRVPSLTEKNLSGFVGNIRSAEKKEIGGDSYLQLGSEKMKTMLLCGKDDVIVDALKHCYEQSLIALKTVSSNDLVVNGGGCLETQLAICLLQELSSSKYVRIYVTSLLKLSQAVCKRPSLNHKVDSRYYHHWIEDSLKCCCGMFMKTSEMEFVGFLELIKSNSSLDSLNEFKHQVRSSILENEPAGVLLHSQTIFSHNFASSVQLATMVLRIGATIVHKTSS